DALEHAAACLEGCSGFAADRTKCQCMQKPAGGPDGLVKLRSGSAYDSVAGARRVPSLASHARMTPSTSGARPVTCQSARRRASARWRSTIGEWATAAFSASRSAGDSSEHAIIDAFSRPLVGTLLG